MSLALVRNERPEGEPLIQIININTQTDTGSHFARITLKQGRDGSPVTYQGRSETDVSHAIVAAFACKILPGIELGSLTVVPRAGDFDGQGVDVTVTLKGTVSNRGTASGKDLIRAIAEATALAVNRALSRS